MKSGEGFGSMVELFMLEVVVVGKGLFTVLQCQYYTLCAGWVGERLAATDSLKPAPVRLVSSPWPVKISAIILLKHVWLFLMCFDPVLIIFRRSLKIK